MRLRRHAHACVEVIVDDARVVVDPGELGDPVDLTDVTAVLVTHDHFDHVDHELLRAAYANDRALRVIGPSSLATALDVPVETVSAGDTVTVGSLDVEVVGSLQEPGSLHEDPGPNVGFLLGGRVLHPGDAYQEVSDVEVLRLPVHGPWVRRTEQERYLAERRPRTLVGIRDALLNEEGRAFAAHTLEDLADAIDADATSLDEGETLELP